MKKYFLILLNYGIYDFIKKCNKNVIKNVIKLDLNSDDEIGLKFLAINYINFKIIISFNT